MSSSGRGGLAHNGPMSEVVDKLLELSIVGSFSRTGYVVRKRVEGWRDPERLDGRAMIVTGATSGIGRATAIELAALGADVWLVGRNPERLRAARSEAEATQGGGRIFAAEVDLVDPRAVASLADRVASTHHELHALIHNAGALFPTYGVEVDNSIPTERTLALHVLAPFRLTWQLAPLLCATDQSVIATVTSGGMYTQRFNPERIDIPERGYRGAVAYARAKRAQVVLSHEWARRWGDHGVASYAVHPGWVDTPGLRDGLPRFAHLGPLLRSPAQGADTVAWLAANEPRRNNASAPSEGLWHDRHRRGEYYVPTTRRSTLTSQRDGTMLWNWCAERTGLGR